MTKKKVKKIVCEILKDDLARQVGNNCHLLENFRKEIAEVHAATIDVIPTLTAIWNHPTFEPYRSKPRG